MNRPIPLIGAAIPSAPLAFSTPDGGIDWRALALARGEEILALQTRIRELETERTER